MKKQIGDYVFENFLGSGSYGEVYKARNQLTNEVVAVKMIDRSKIKGKLYELLQNELHVLQNCKNENIIHLIKYSKTENNFYMIMEYCNEGDLRDFLKYKGYLTEREAVKVIAQIINAFKVLHSNHVIHRDLKPANILIHNGMVKIADFGFCKLLSGSNYTSTILGTPSYMAPEILLKQPYNYKVDIWSLGVMFFELLYGRVPFGGKDRAELYEEILKKNPTFDKRVTAGTQELISKMLCVDPIKRASWEQLFAHEICQQESASIENSGAQFQVKKVIEHPSEIEMKETDETVMEDELEMKHIVGVVYIKCPIQKECCRRLFHERNAYTFVAENAYDSFQLSFGSKIIGYLLQKKVVKLYHTLNIILQKKINPFGLEYWGRFTKTRKYQQICYLIQQELHICQKVLERYQSQIANDNPYWTNQVVFNVDKLLRYEVRRYFEGFSEKWLKKKEFLIHVDNLQDSVDLDASFEKGTNFHQYYENKRMLEVDQLEEQVVRKYKALVE